jgi:hypothetical protein
LGYQERVKYQEGPDMFKKIASTALLFVFLLSSVPVFAEDETEKTLFDSINNGVIGGLFGLVAKTFSSDPDTETKKEETNLRLPTIKTDNKVYDMIADEHEVIFGMDLFSFKF